MVFLDKKNDKKKKKKLNADIPNPKDTYNSFAQSTMLE